MSRDAYREPRKKTLWLEGYKAFLIEVPGLGSMANVVIGATNKRGKITVRLQLELNGIVKPKSMRKLLSAANDAVTRILEEEAADQTLTRLGSTDSNESVPALQNPRGKQIFGMWIRKAFYRDAPPQVALGMRVRYEDKDTIKDLFRSTTEQNSKILWWPETKLWCFSIPTGYGHFLKALSEFQILWFSRDGFPPPPAILR